MNVWCVYLMIYGEVILNPTIGTNIGRFLVPAASLEDARDYIMGYGGDPVVVGEHVNASMGWHLVATQFGVNHLATFAIREEPVYVAEVKSPDEQ